MSAKRTYLYVPYEERCQVKKLGAHFDDELKCWYIEETQDPAPFKRWLDGPDEVEETYTSESDDAFVVVAKTECWSCQAKVEVVCIYCETGKIEGAEYKQFSLSEVTEIDAALKKQLKKWPHYRLGVDPDVETECYLNHCPKCKEPQGDYFLHCEPAGAFFSIMDAPKGSIRFVPLKGKVRLSGSEGFEP